MWGVQDSATGDQVAVKCINKEAFPQPVTHGTEIAPTGMPVMVR